MCGARCSGLFAFVVIFSLGFGGGVWSGDFRTPRAKKEAESGEYVEVAVPRERESGHFNYYRVVAGGGADAGNGSGAEVGVRKCCAGERYLDVENLTCVGGRSEGATTRGESVRGGEERLLGGGMPECGARSVVSVWAGGGMSVGASGLRIEGEGVFSEFCVDGDARGVGRTVALACAEAERYCRSRTCYRKCCPLGYAYELSERRCEKTEEGFRAAFYELSSLSRVEGPGVEERGIYLTDACGSKGKYLLEKGLGEVSYLGVDGSLFVPVLEKRFSESEFCVEFVKAGNSSSLESFLCFPKSGSHFENSPLQFFLLSLGLIISCMFLLVTFLVYLFSPKGQNLYEKTLMCYIACLFTAYLCLAIIELLSKDLDKTVCTRMGYFLLFAFLAAFFWLNVISFDIWKTFRSNRSVERSKSDRTRFRFILYSLYAWGFPSAITSLCAYANQREDFPFEGMRPDIGVENCWFSKKKKGIYVFFVAPISLVIAVNIFFYVQTAWQIWKVKSEVKKMEKHQRKGFSAKKDQFVINGKLFIVMGITWSLEIISFFAPHPIWYITDTGNALHGVFIFAIFVLKKKVLQRVSEQVRAPLKRMRQLTTSNSEDLSTNRRNLHESNTEGKTCQSS